MKQNEIIQQRLFNQGLATRRFATSQEVTDWLGAIQGQDYHGAKWSIGLRTNLKEDEVEEAISERKVIRTWPLRGTLHLVCPKDIRWILSVSRPVMVRQLQSLFRQHELTEKVFTKCFKIFEDILKDGKSLTRNEIAEVLHGRKIDTDNNRLSFIFYRAGMEALVCFGARRGKQFTYTLLDEWSPGINPYTTEEALGELARRYFQSRGPATLRDFMWWSGLPKGQAAQGLEAVKNDLLKDEFQENTYYFPNSPPQKKFTRSLLLPGFDEYVLGYADRSLILDIAYKDMVKQGNATFLSTVLINGRVQGFWRRNLQNDKVVIEARPITPFSKAHTASIQSAAKDFGKFLRMEPTLLEATTWPNKKL